MMRLFPGRGGRGGKSNYRNDGAVWQLNSWQALREVCVGSLLIATRTQTYLVLALRVLLSTIIVVLVQVVVALALLARILNRVLAMITVTIRYNIAILIFV